MEEKRIYYVGIDHGNHLMKTSNHVFENGVERQAVKPTFQANTLVYDGAFYKIGEKRNSVKDSKLADDDYYLLTLAALAKECQSGNIPNGARVVLGVGLPLKQFATVRKQFVKYLKRGNQPVHFKFEDVAYDFTIENVLAFPQCYAAVADRLGSMKGEYLIVDVGSCICWGMSARILPWLYETSAVGVWIVTFLIFAMFFINEIHYIAEMRKEGKMYGIVA